MKSISITLIFILFNVSLIAQSVHIATGSGVGEFATNMSLEKTAPEIKGSPYYNKDFMFGEAETYRGENFSGMFRYNIYNEEMEFIYKFDTLIIDNPIILKYINFAAKKFTYSVIVDNFWRSNYIYGGYFEVFNEGPVQFLIRYVMDFRHNRFVPYYAGGGGDGSYRYMPEERLYIRLNIDEPAFRIKQNKRFFFNTFPQHKNEISNFIKKNRIDFNDKKDLTKLVDFINTL